MNGEPWFCGGFYRFVLNVCRNKVAAAEGLHRLPDASWLNKNLDLSMKLFEYAISLEKTADVSNAATRMIEHCLVESGVNAARLAMVGDRDTSPSTQETVRECRRALRRLVIATKLFRGWVDLPPKTNRRALSGIARSLGLSGTVRNGTGASKRSDLLRWISRSTVATPTRSAQDASPATTGTPPGLQKQACFTPMEAACSLLR